MVRMESTDINIALSNLDNQELHTLSQRVEDHIDDVDVDVMGIRLFSDKFKEEAHVYRESIEQQSVNAALVTALDARRDGFYIALRGNLTLTLDYHPDEKYRKNAQKLIKILNKDGKRIYEVGYKKETSALMKIIKEVDKNWLKVLDELGARPWYNFLKTAQSEFEAAVKTLSVDVAENKKTESATASRKSLERAIRKLFAFLPMQFEMTSDEVLGELISKLQVTADRF